MCCALMYGMHVCMCGLGGTNLASRLIAMSKSAFHTRRTCADAAAASCAQAPSIAKKRARALGLIGHASVRSPSAACAACSVRHTADFPEPAGPSRNTDLVGWASFCGWRVGCDARAQLVDFPRFHVALAAHTCFRMSACTHPCALSRTSSNNTHTHTHTHQRTTKISRSWLTLRQNVASAWKPSDDAALLTCHSRVHGAHHDAGSVLSCEAVECDDAAATRARRPRKTCCTRPGWFEGGGQRGVRLAGARAFVANLL